MSKISIERQILALTDDQLEQFVREWTSHKKEYVEVQRFSGPGDKGRDVVGYLTKERHEGPWHNYQCKQYGRTLRTGLGLGEVGKVLYYSHCGEFTAPTRFFFVAPRGLHRDLKRYIAKPSEFKAALVATWDQNCSKTIIEGQVISLSDALRAFLDQCDFSAISSISADELVQDPAAKPVLKAWFDVDPGPAPIGVVPEEIKTFELPYIQQLLDAYGEREGQTLAQKDARDHETHGPHMYRQRERFFDADSFSRFYRDNTMQEDIDVLRRDVRHGIDETHRAMHADSLSRADAVMIQAANLQPSGALAKHARVPVRQGICHHFVNEGILKWRKT